MFGNSPYDLVAPAMIGELHRSLTREHSTITEPPRDTETGDTETLSQRIMAALTPRQLRLAPDAECGEG